MQIFLAQAGNAAPRDNNAGFAARTTGQAAGATGITRPVIPRMFEPLAKAAVAMANSSVPIALAF